uniref:F207A protein n=1 Tax=Catharus ustulatus TaxID=91951 RepID=A0A8C3V741_CATUS
SVFPSCVLGSWFRCPPNTSKDTTPVNVFFLLRNCLCQIQQGFKDWDFSSPGVFSGLKIDPDTLVKKLDLDSRSIISSRTGLEEKTVLSKKEKMKLRKERWLQKIESVKMAKQKQKAEAKRKATPVVGDMQPLMEALPELSFLTTGGRGRKPLKRYLTWADVTCTACDLLTPNQPHLVLAWRSYRLFFPLLASGFLNVCIEEAFEIIRGGFYRI